MVTTTQPGSPAAWGHCKILGAHPGFFLTWLGISYLPQRGLQVLSKHEWRQLYWKDAEIISESDGSVEGNGSV